MLGEDGVPEGIRTPDLRFRKPLLYPAELPGRGRSAPEGAARQAHYSRKALTRSRAISLALALLAPTQAPLQAAAQTCPGQREAVGEAARVNERLEIELSDGRLLRQTGLAPFPKTPEGRARHEAARQAIAARLRGATIEAPSPLPQEDRWGRISGHLLANGASLGAWLAAAGLMRAAPEAGDPCGRLILSAEAKARQAKLGLWADPYYSVLTADKVVALTARRGEFVLVEGRILRLGQTSARFYLDFGPARGVDLNVTISRQAAKSFAAAGMNIEALPGRRVRVRGVIENRQGPSIELISPFALEMMGH